MKVRRKKGTSRFDFGLFSILHEDEFVRPRGAVVIDGEEQRLHLTIFKGVVEPRLSTTEDGKDVLVVVHLHGARDGVHGGFSALIEQVVAFSPANHRALEASLDVHVDVAVGDFEPILSNASDETLVRLHGRASHEFRLTVPNDVRTP